MTLTGAQMLMTSKQYRHTSTLAAVTATLFMLACGGRPAAQTADDAAATLAEFHDAMRSGDSALVLQLLAPDVVIYEGGSAEASREEYGSHHLPADMRYAATTTRHATVERTGTASDIAWVLSRVHTTGTYDGRAVDRGSVETVIFRREPEGWRIIHIHWSASRQ